MSHNAKTEFSEESALSQPSTCCGEIRAATCCGETVAAGSQREAPHLSDLVPIAVVIAAGCEPCAEKMVRRALDQRASPAHIASVLRIIASMQKLDCLAQALGPEAVRRMEKPLAAAERTLRQVLMPSL